MVNHSMGIQVPPPPFSFVPPSPLFQWVRLGLGARGPSAAASSKAKGHSAAASKARGRALRLEKARGPSVSARAGVRGTKKKGGGGVTRNPYPILGKSKY